MTIAPRPRTFLLCLFWLAGGRAEAQTDILWNSDAGKTNLTSTGALFDGQFNFELGVFAAPFVPTPANVAEWAAHWHSAGRTTYDASSKRYAASFLVADNDAPFAVGKAGYVWGFRGDPASAEWILFRASSWTWPNAFPPMPAVYWYAKDATAVLGAIHAGGAPFLMQSAAVTNASPPPTSWSQWQEQFFTDQALAGPNADPDHDGTPNLLEYVFGSAPLAAGPPTATPVAIVGGHLQITIPRRSDHPATLVVEVAADLTNWRSGPAYTTVVSDGLTALMVRDLTALDAAHPQRFMRLKAELADP